MLTVESALTDLVAYFRDNYADSEIETDISERALELIEQAEEALQHGD